MKLLPAGPDEVLLYKKCERFSLLYFPMLLIFLYAFSIKQTDAPGDCPIVIDLNNNGQIDITGFTATQDKLYTLFSTGRFVQFDVFGDGEKSNIDWIAGNTDGIVIEWNANNPKKELTGLDLMGVRRIYDDGRDESFDNGYAKMASYDLNSDGALSGEELEHLALWVDDGNAVLDDGEIFTFEAKGITSVSVIAHKEQSYYGFSALRSTASTASGEILTEDVWFLNEQAVQLADLRIASALRFAGL